NQPKNFICTADDMYFVFIEEKKHTEILALYDPMTGEHVHYVKLSYPAYKEITLMVTIPKQPYLIGLIDSEKGIVMNVRDKKVHLTLPKWGGQISSNGRYGLYAPTCVFDIMAFFTPTNEHVIYYHKGKRTIRVFRAKDGPQLVDMKCPAKVRQGTATNDGRILVVGYEDGAIQAFLIVDRSDESMVDYLRSWRIHQLQSTVEPERQETAERQLE
ncbi:unnamed protein product, partial [Rotaria sp. Silwood2]